MGGAQGPESDRKLSHIALYLAVRTLPSRARRRSSRNWRRRFNRAARLRRISRLRPSLRTRCCWRGHPLFLCAGNNEDDVD
jgi:plasmid stabilization system protein ParE